MKRLVKFFAIVAVLVTLTACGGGGDGGAGGGDGDSGGGGTTKLNWGLPQLVSDNFIALPDAPAPHVLLNANGDGHIAFIKGLNARSLVGYLIKNHVIEPLERNVTVIASGSLREPKLASLANGEFVAAWIEESTDQSGGPLTVKVRSARTIDQGTIWLPADTLFTRPADQILSGLQLVSNGMDMALLAFQYDYLGGVTSYAYFGAGGRFFSLPIAMPESQSPSVALTADGGGLIAVSTKIDGGEPGTNDDVLRVRLLTAAQHDGVSKVVTMGLGPGFGPSRFPEVAVGADGGAVVAWEQQVAPTGVPLRVVAFATASDARAQNWTDVQTAVPASEIADAREVSVTRDALGTSTLVWREVAQEPDGSEPDSVKALRVGSQTTPVQTISAPELRLGTRTPLVGSDGTGRAVVVWAQRSPSESSPVGNFKTMAAGFDPVTGRWGVAEAIDAGLQFSGIPNGAELAPMHSLAVNSSGKAVALWRQQVTASDSRIALNIMK